MSFLSLPHGLDVATAEEGCRESSTRFRQDIKVRIDAYESWECPLCVAKFLDMGRIFSYLWIRIFYIR